MLIPVRFAASAAAVLLSTGCAQPADGPASESLPSSAAPAPVSDVGYSMDDVASHSVEADCWTVVAGNVYDVTAWLPVHPGGPAVIAAVCGKDGSGAFFNQHAGQSEVLSMLAEFQVGYRVDDAG